MKKTKNNYFYKFTEKCLYEFVTNCAKLEKLQYDFELLKLSGDVQAQKYEQSFSHGSVSDPVFARLVKLENAEREIKKLERLVNPVKNLVSYFEYYPSRKNFILLKILELYYFGGYTVEAVLQDIHFSRSCFFEQKKILVRKAMSYFGF